MIKNITLLLFIITCIIYTTKNSIAQSKITGKDNSKFSFGFSERIRLVSYDDLISFSEDANSSNTFTRIRTTVSGMWTPTGTFSFAIKLGHEFRNYFSPVANDFHMNEIFLDQLYIKWKTDDFLKGRLTLGRQNMRFGEGFLVMDSSPLDGSRSSYFNAIRYDWYINSQSMLTVFGNYMDKTDDLPVINGNDIDEIFQGDGSCKLVEQKQTGTGLYYTGNFSNINLQSYYLRKDYLDPDESLGQIEADVNALGSRVRIDISDHFSSTIEAAFQLGNYGDHNKKAYGGYAYVDYNTMWKQGFLPKVFTIGAVYLSGDDLSTEDNEGWDPMFSRWPKWSEGYVLFSGQRTRGNLLLVEFCITIFNTDI